MRWKNTHLLIWYCIRFFFFYCNTEDKNDLNNFKSNLKINGNISERINIERFDGNIKIDNKLVVDFSGNIKNNYISSNFNIINNKTGIDLKINGNIKEGVYNIDSEVRNLISTDLINSKISWIISFDNEINLIVSDSFDIEAYISFKDIEIENSNKKIYLKDLSDLNNKIQEGLVQENREYDFKLKSTDDKTAPITLVRLIVAKLPLSEKQIGAEIFKLSIFCGILAVITAFFMEVKIWYQ